MPPRWGGLLRRTVTGSAPPSTAVIKRTVSFFRDNELRLLLSDKEGGFVIAPSAVFNKKAIEAVNKNFILANEKAQKVKRKAISLLENIGLTKIVKNVKQCKVLALEVFSLQKRTNRMCLSVQ